MFGVCSRSCLEVDGDAERGVKRKLEEDISEHTSGGELQECLLNTCIRKLSLRTSSASSRSSLRRRSLRHAVLIHNMLQSLERVGRLHNIAPPSPCRPRLTARRRSLDTDHSTTTSERLDLVSLGAVELSASSELQLRQQSSPWKQQQPVESSPWKQQQQQPVEQSLSSLDTNTDEKLMSSTTTFTPLLPADLTPSSVIPRFDVSTSLTSLEQEQLDAGCDWISYDTDLTFAEPLLFYKTTGLDTGTSFDSSDRTTASVDFSDDTDELLATSSSYELFSSTLDPQMLSILVECWVIILWTLLSHVGHQWNASNWTLPSLLQHC